MGKLYKEVLRSDSFQLLQNISQNKSLNTFFLAGGTSLALQIGHRISDDLDFFTKSEFKSNLLSEIQGKYEVITLHDNSIEIIQSNTKVSFLFFAFPLYKKLKKAGNIRLADPIDIGLMKLLALQGRTTKKDIVDLYFIDKEIIQLEKLLKLFESHFPKESFNSYSSIKELFNLEELAAEPMPKMIKKVKWEEALEKVLGEVSRFVRQTVD
ncbi:nucleotidyl transferase AbiEii/AbiGii toxin family protein [Candidatus Dojkabacteria bacterium]|nr:nucleotidyl transferase AbiEii/AbiGii toxin family protein [Candidatus Dojkabacteria bacterium]